MHQIPRAKTPRFNTDPGRNRRDRKESSPPFPRIHRHAHFPRKLIALDRGHVSPERHHTHPSKNFVTIIKALSARGRHAWCHHKRPRFGSRMKLIAVHVKLPKKLIQRSVSNCCVHVRNLRPAFLRILLDHQLPALIELVDFAEPSNRHIVAAPLSLNLRIALQTPRPQSVQRNDWKQWENTWQTNTNIHGLEHGEIPITNRFRIELLERLPQKVHRLAFPSILAHLLGRSPQRVRHAAGSLRRLGRVFANVFDNSPKIQTRPPINITKVRQQHVSIIACAQGIVSRKASVPRPFAIPLLQLHLPLAISPHKLLWKTITTIQTPWLSSRARIFLSRKTICAMPVMPPASLHQSCDQTTNGLQIQSFPRTFFCEKIVQQSPQIHTDGRFPHKVVSRIHLDVVRPDILVETEAHLPIVRITWIPFGNFIPEHFPEFLFHRLLALLSSGVTLSFATHIA